MLLLESYVDHPFNLSWRLKAIYLLESSGSLEVNAHDDILISNSTCTAGCARNARVLSAGQGILMRPEMRALDEHSELLIICLIF